MNSDRQLRFLWIQIIAWTIALGVIFIYSYNKFGEFNRAIVYAVLVTTVYVITVYVHSHWLIPNWYNKSIWAYGIFSSIFLVVITLLRMLLEYVVMHKLMYYTHFFDFDPEHFSFSFVTTTFAFMFGALLRISINHFFLLQKEQERNMRHMAAELQLLKSQVQPHFLFNALNNIYYLAYIKSDLAPQSISRLSDTMRYFVEEAPKEWVPLSTEVQFIRDYIDIERMRLSYGIDVSLNFPLLDNQVLVPPMLFIPLVENVFKHGVDRTRSDNMLLIDVIMNDDYLELSVKNLLHQQPVRLDGGTGIKNLRRRLDILYGSNYILQTNYEVPYFIAYLKIPLK